MTNLVFDKLKAVNDEESFVDFARALVADREGVEAIAPTLDGFQGEWANQSISAFVGAGISWADDSDFGSRPGPKPSNPWTLFAQFLWAGRTYE